MLIFELCLVNELLQYTIARYNSTKLVVYRGHNRYRSLNLSESWEGKFIAFLVAVILLRKVCLRSGFLLEQLTTFVVMLQICPSQ